MPMRGDRLDAVLGQDLEQLLLNHVEARRDARGARGPQGFDGALEIVERLEQVARQRADRVDPVGVGLLLGALLVIGELGPAPEGLVAELVALLLQLGDLFGSRHRLTVGRIDLRRWLRARCPGSAAGCRSTRRRSSPELESESSRFVGSWLDSFMLRSCSVAAWPVRTGHAAIQVKTRSSRRARPPR